MTLLTCEGDIGQQFGEAKTGMVIFKEVPLASRYLSENGLHKCLPFTDSLCFNSTLCKCVVFVYSKRGGFKCLCPLEPLFSL